MLELGFDGPVFDRGEGVDLAFALDDEAEGNGLDAAGGEAATDLVPEERGDLVADEAVENAAGLLGVHQVFVDVASVRKAALTAFWVISLKVTR